MVDAPRNASQKNLAQVEAQKMRPYLILIHPTSVIAKVWATDVTGLRYLKQVRIKTVTKVQGADYKEETVERVKVYTTDQQKCTVQTFELQKEGNSSSTVEIGVAEVLDIPFVPILHVPFDEDEEDWPYPPLEGLAWLALAHYQSMSDQRNILRIARAGLLLLTGLTGDDVKKSVTFGPNYVFKTTNDKADGKFIEYEGSSIQAGERDLKDLETRMELLGLAPLLQKTARVAATSRAIDEDKSQSAVQAWAHRFAEVLAQAITMAGYFFKTPIEVKPIEVKIFTDFGVSLYTQTELDTLSKARANGDLTRKTYLDELQSRGLLNENLEVADEAKQAEAEAQAKAEAELAKKAEVPSKPE